MEAEKLEGTVLRRDSGLVRVLEELSNSFEKQGQKLEDSENSAEGWECMVEQVFGDSEELEKSVDGTVDTRAASEIHMEQVDSGNLEQRDCTAQAKIDVPPEHRLAVTDQVQM